MVDGNVNEVLEQIRDVINNVINKTLGTTKLKSMLWFNRICEEVAQSRKVARQKWLNDTRNEKLFARYKTHLRGPSNIISEKKIYIYRYVRNYVMNYAELDYKAHGI